MLLHRIARGKKDIFGQTSIGETVLIEVISYVLFCE